MEWLPEVEKYCKIRYDERKSGTEEEGIWR